MIEQTLVQAKDKTTPPIQDIRQWITQAVERIDGSGFDRLKKWLQIPTDSTFKKAVDSDCLIRAGKVGAWLSMSGSQPYTPASLSVKLGAEGRWKAIDANLDKGVPVVIQAASNYVCGDRSCFRNEIGFHTIVFLANGNDGRKFYLGFDPDVSATDGSRAKWTELLTADVQINSLDEARGIYVIKAIMLGDSPDGFGPLIRKYYVVDQVFPAIKRVDDSL